MTDTLDRRLVRLERRQRWLTAALLGAVAGLVLVAATDGSSAIRTSQIDLVDDSGRTRATLAADQGFPTFALLDEHGVERVRLAHDAEQSGLFIRDEDGVTRVGAVQFAHGGGGFALHGPESNGAAVLYLKGDGVLRFFDGEGRVTDRYPPAEP